MVASVFVCAPAPSAVAQGASEESGVEVIDHGEESETEDESSEGDGDEGEDASEAESDVEVIRHGEESEGEKRRDTAQSEEDRADSSEGDSRVESIDHSGESQEDESGSDENGEESTATAGNESADPRRESEFSARYGFGTWVDTQWQEGREDVVESRGDVGLELRQDLSTQWSAVANGELRYWAGAMEGLESPRASAEVRLEESYALYQSNRWAVRFGHLRTPWGSTSLIRPGDVVNPVDATAFANPTDPGGRLSPQPTAEIAHVRPNWSLTALVVPFFVPNRVTLFGRDSAVAAGQNRAIGGQIPVADVFRRLLDRSIYEEAQPLLASPSRPDERPENASFGLRWTGTRWNTDFGFGYFFGWDRTPSIEVDDDLRELAALAADDGQVLRDFDIQEFINRRPEALDLLDSISARRRAGGTVVDVEHRRLHTVVANVSRYVGPIGLRGDVALQPERTFVTDALRTVRRPTIFAAAGASYERFVSDRPFVATLEGFWLEPLGADAAPTRWFAGDDERGTQSSEILLVGPRYRGVAGAIDWAMPVGELELRVGGIVELDAGGAVVNASLSRRWASWFRASVGSTFYEGFGSSDRLSIGALYDRNDRIGLKIDGSF